MKIPFIVAYTKFILIRAQKKKEKLGAFELKLNFLSFVIP